MVRQRRGRLGHRLSWGRRAVGTILAAAGTALPESVGTLVAVVFDSGDDAHDMGVGRGDGGLLVLATLTYGVTGGVMLTRRRAPVPLGGAAAGSAAGDDIGDAVRLVRDQA